MGIGEQDEAVHAVIRRDEYWVSNSDPYPYPVTVTQGAGGLVASVTRFEEGIEKGERLTVLEVFVLRAHNP